jgi:2-dehydro-3-deoxyphosphogluconate aldolase/(4S)-4-hydroxy-2-oxoglutarate aldolase
VAAGPARHDAYAAKIAAVVARLQSARVVPVTTLDDASQAEAVCAALVRGGLPCIEIAFRTAAAVEALGRVSAVAGLLVGAGTVLSPEQAQLAAEAGADFAVAPGLNEDVVEACRKAGLPFVPGIATPSEIERARALGLHTLKVFPVEQLGGPGFIKAIALAYRDVGFLPTGGVAAETLRAYLAEPSVIACAGSWIVKRDLLQGGRFDEVERLAREAAELAQ